MDRYFLFAWYYYEAQGGMNDLQFIFRNKEKAIKKAKKMINKFDCVEIWDKKENKTILTLDR